MIRVKLRDLLFRKQAEESRKITYAEVAAETQISASTLSRIANNHRVRFDTQTLSKLCQFFNCQIGDLLEYSSDEESPNQL